MIPFIPDGRFGWIHHRFLNNLEWLDALTTHIGKRRDFVDLAEGDVCWFREGGEYVFYMWHPKVLSPLRPPEARAGLESGELHRLEDILDEKYARIPFVVELKAGDGPEEEAIPELVSRLQSHRPGLFWIDSFSPGQLALVKQASASALTSLHTRLVFRGTVLKTAFELPPISLARLAKLPQVDIVTATYKHSLARSLRPFGHTIDSVHRDVRKSGKQLSMGGIYSHDELDLVRRSFAVAGNVRFDLDRFRSPLPSPNPT